MSASRRLSYIDNVAIFVLSTCSGKERSHIKMETFLMYLGTFVRGRLDHVFITTAAMPTI